VIRKHALGNFGELLSASAHSPAMLTYLDNQANHKDAPNENYARELLELLSLGVDGGYSQQDVMELARCLTGWTIKEHFWRGDFVFKKENHDDDSKFVLGRLFNRMGSPRWKASSKSWRFIRAVPASLRSNWRDASSPTTLRPRWWRVLRKHS
jgi:uncharacterized protein (DUF1800 family)